MNRAQRIRDSAASTSAGKLVGTFAVYSRRPRAATRRGLDFAAHPTQVAAMILSQHAESEVRRRVETALRESEERYGALFASRTS